MIFYENNGKYKQDSTFLLRDDLKGQEAQRILALKTKFKNYHFLVVLKRKNPACTIKTYQIENQALK
jgi:hypothetical protein